MPGTGKSALVAKLAIECGFPYVQKISPEKLVGLSTWGKQDKINKTFVDSQRSSLSCIIVEDIERLIEFTSLG